MKKRRLPPVLDAVMDWMNQYQGLEHADQKDADLEVMRVLVQYQHGHLSLKDTLGRIRRQTRRCERIHAQNYPD